MTAGKEREHSSPPDHTQPQHPQPSQSPSPSQPLSLSQPIQSEPPVHNFGDSNALGAASKESDTALTAMGYLGTDHHSDRRHNKTSHAHFADDDDVSSAQDDTERNESITAVRGAARGEGGGHAAGTFWEGLDATSSGGTAAGAHIRLAGFVRLRTCMTLLMLSQLLTFGMWVCTTRGAASLV